MVEINPIIPGFAPDPSIVRVDDTYFLVNSSFHFFPGIPVYASKDLVSWTHIGDALNRSSQLSLSRTASKISRWNRDRQMVGNRGIYAPTIRHYSGKFYIICSNILHGSNGVNSDVAHHMIISTENIYSNHWSEPVAFDFDGGDPSLFFEGDRVYVQMAAAQDASIHQFEIDIETGELISPSKAIWSGTGRAWLESPHIYKKDDYYYLLVAEGGCFDQHALSIARSTNLWGPYEGSPENPILTASQTSNYIQNVGHGDFVQDMNGDWWVVVLGVRQRDDSFVLGRETFLTQVEWSTSGWPSILPVTMDIPKGNHTLSERSTVLANSPPEFIFIRDRIKSNYLERRGGYLSLYPNQHDLSDDDGSPTFIGRRQRVLYGAATVSILIQARNEDHKSHFRGGLAMYKDEHRFCRIFFDSLSEKVCFEAVNRLQQLSVTNSTTLPKVQDNLSFKIRHTELLYEVSYSIPRSKEDVVVGSVSTAQMSDLDFVGPVIGPFVVAHKSSLGETPVDFTNFHLS